MNSSFPVIHDHDGHVDDLISLALLATAENKKLHATTLTPADCYLEPATKAVEKLLTLFNKTDVLFARSFNEGVNPFPDLFRKDSNHLPTLDIFKDIKKTTINCLDRCTAPELLVEILSGSQKFEIVETGPLTNIAEAIQINPAIVKNINRIYMMGGAIHVHGNVDTEPKHDGSAEWNMYNNPASAQIVLSSGVPMTLVPLDITNEFPVTKDFVGKLKSQMNSPLSQLAYHSMQIVLANPDQNYYMWDILTAIVFLQPNLFNYVQEKISIVVEGASAGRTYPDKNGFEVTVPKLIDRSSVEEFLLKLFCK